MGKSRNSEPVSYTHLDVYKRQTDDIYTTVEKMREAGVAFLDTPDTYFDVIDQRIPCLLYTSRCV